MLHMHHFIGECPQYSVEQMTGSKLCIQRSEKAKRDHGSSKYVLQSKALLLCGCGYSTGVVTALCDVIWCGVVAKES